MDHVQWDAVNIMRLVAVIVTCGAAMEMVMMLSYYYWRLMPLRKQVGEKVIAPPVVWTFAYHGFVTALLVIDAITKMQSIILGNKATLSTWLAPVVLIGLTVTINRFQAYYSKTLGKAQWDHLRR